MSTSRIFQIAGWCALVGAVSMVAAIVLFIAAPPLGAAVEVLDVVSMANYGNAAF